MHLKTNLLLLPLSLSMMITLFPVKQNLIGNKEPTELVHLDHLRLLEPIDCDDVPIWISDTYYLAGEYVVYHGKLYQVRQNHYSIFWQTPDSQPFIYRFLRDCDIWQ